MTKKRQNVCIDEELLDKAKEYSVENQYRSLSSFVQLLLERELGTENSLKRKSQRRDESNNEPHNFYLRTRVTESEFYAFEDKRLIWGFDSVSLMLRKLIREFINEVPELRQEELRELQEANKNLLAIGRNLNQIARKMNYDDPRHRGITPQYMEQLITFIDQQRRATMDMVAFQANRSVREWNDKESSSND